MRLEDTGWRARTRRGNLPLYSPHIHVHRDGDTRSILPDSARLRAAAVDASRKTQDKAMRDRIVTCC